jgi:hypothetical protein
MHYFIVSRHLRLGQSVLNTLFWNNLSPFSLFFVVCTLFVIASLSENQQMHKLINKYNMYPQLLHMFRQINCLPQGVFINELQVDTTSKYTIGGCTVEVFTQLTILKCIDA